MFDLATNVLALIFVLGVLVFVHELGHFLVAKAFGVGVEVFSLGFGTRLFGFRRGDTDYRISALPLGGYVKMVGENPDEEIVGADNEYLSKPKWQRLLILVAGPAMNIALAFVLTVAVYQLGITVLADSDQPVVIGMVEQGSPAAEAGLQPGDRIVAVNGDEMPDWDTFRVRVLIAPGEPLDLSVIRDGRELSIPVTPERTEGQETGRVGIASPLPPEIGLVQEDGPAEAAGLQPGDLIVAVDDTPVGHYNEALDVIAAAEGEPVQLRVRRNGDTFETTFAPRRNEAEQLVIGWAPDPDRVRKVRTYPLGESITRAGAELKRQSLLLGEILKRLFTGRMSVRTLSGPIEIARFSGATARTGDPSVVLSFMAFISLQLGILNLLPIPVLDGGQITLILFEGAIRRDLSLQVKERIMQIGVILLISLMAMVIVLDISKIIPASWWDVLPF